jgi:hyperosmotically inducible protein
MNRKPLYILMTTALSAALAMPVYAGDLDETATENAKDRSAGQVVDDMSIAARLKTALATDPTTDAIDIDIEVDRDQVQLNGFVDSDEARNRAGENARSTKGVALVKNNLQVQPQDRTAGE